MARPAAAVQSPTESGESGELRGPGLRNRGLFRTQRQRKDFPKWVVPVLPRQKGAEFFGGFHESIG